MKFLQAALSALVPVMLSVLIPRPVHALEDYSQWTHYREITLNTTASGANVATDAVKFPLLVRLGSDQADVFTGAAETGADLRFAKPDGTPLPYQIESWHIGVPSAAIWVGLDTVKGNSSTQTFLMYWGKPGAADSSRSAAVFDTAAGYRGVWHLSGSRYLQDATGYGNHGIDSGSLTNPEAQIGQGRYFGNPMPYVNNGKYIALGNPASMNFAGNITMEAWVRWDSRDGHRIILCHGSSHLAAAGGNTETVIRVGEYLDYRTGVWNGTVHHAAFVPTAADSNTWVHLAGVHNGTAWILYRNGVQVAATPDANGAQTTPGSWRIGAQYNGGNITRYFHGSLDEIRLSRVARSADWIKLGYESQKTGSTLLTVGATRRPGIVGLPFEGAPGAFQALILRASGRELLRLPMESPADARGRVTLALLDLRGRILWQATAKANRDPTTGDLVWNGRDSRGLSLPPGKYLARVTLRSSAGGKQGKVMDRTLELSSGL